MTGKENTMLAKQVLSAERLRYRKPIAIARQYLDKMNVVPETDIDIYVDYPVGWHAVVGANNRVYILICMRGNITLEIQPVWGFRPNGKIIIK
jgi:hypothetical protein